jgi:hypothetical protein
MVTPEVTGGSHRQPSTVPEPSLPSPGAETLAVNDYPDDSFAFRAFTWL